MAEYICQYCGKEFTRKYNLQVHQKNTRYCIEKQLRPEEPPKDTQLLLIDMIDQLQQTISKLGDLPAVSNNRHVVLNGLQPLTDQDLQEHLLHLTLDHIQEGAKGYANFAGSYPFKDRLVCTDKSRKKIRYKSNNGELVNDDHGAKLTQQFFRAIADRNEKIITDEYTVLQKQVQQIASAGTAHKSNLTSILTKATKLQQLLISCQEAARGEENELTKEFISCLTRMI